MILPISDVIGVSKHRSYRIGYSGLVIVIKGHEEVFLELSSAERRDACMKALEKEKGDKQDDEHRELRELVDLSATKDTELSSPDMPHPQSEAIPSQPPIMFSSTTSDFVTFRPEKPLRFTCLTIGSRGDVQPYIALCKGLMAQGHHCKIASHGEYQKWVEGHGIDFAPVGGDPAELMQRKPVPSSSPINFLLIRPRNSHDLARLLHDLVHEGSRQQVPRLARRLARLGLGGLPELGRPHRESVRHRWLPHRRSASDPVLPVSMRQRLPLPSLTSSADLQCPRPSAFTMPWSRTRAYPHAFAVPEVHMGGGYNYMVSRCGLAWRRKQPAHVYSSFAFRPTRCSTRSSGGRPPAK
jgi:sterol 3beta-glucosyltransferase